MGARKSKKLGRHRRAVPREEIVPKAELLDVAESSTNQLAHAPGDKGDTANVGLIALREEFYPLLKVEVTAERVKQHFKGICQGGVERFECRTRCAQLSSA